MDSQQGGKQSYVKDGVGTVYRDRGTLQMQEGRVWSGRKIRGMLLRRGKGGHQQKREIKDLLCCVVVSRKRERRGDVMKRGGGENAGWAQARGGKKKGNKGDVGKENEGHTKKAKSVRGHWMFGIGGT